MLTKLYSGTLRKKTSNCSDHYIKLRPCVVETDVMVYSVYSSCTANLSLKPETLHRTLSLL